MSNMLKETNRGAVKKNAHGACSLVAQLGGLLHGHKRHG